MPLKMSAYVKSYDGETKWMYFFIEDDELLEKYNHIWNKITDSINKELDCEPIYNKELLQNKMVTRLQIFMLNTRLRPALAILV